MNDTVERSGNEILFVISRFYNCWDIDVRADRKTDKHDATDATCDPKIEYMYEYMVYFVEYSI